MNPRCKNVNRDFIRKIETIGVLGLPIEQDWNVGLSYKDFQELLLHYAVANLKRTMILNHLWNFYRISLKELGK